MPNPPDTGALALLFEASKRLARPAHPRLALEQVLESLCDHRDLLRPTMWRHDGDLNQVVVVASVGFSANARRRARYRPGEGITGRVVASGEPIWLRRIGDDPDFLDRGGSSALGDDVGFICVPILDRGRSVGALSALRSDATDALLRADGRILTVLGQMLAPLLPDLRSDVSSGRPRNMIGGSKAIDLVYQQIRQVGPSDATVLLLGESGVGKELVAQAIHGASNRATGPFVKVNCAALPQNLLESELFGHEKGAFTGAFSERKGRFEIAEGGTIFLDEIGDLPPATQVTLLRVLQEREFERVGGNRTIQSNARVIAATHRDLLARIDENQFRADLYYRLNVFPIRVPPLRERRADVIALADFFVDKYSRRQGKSVRRISTPAIDMLMSYHWPGNVRELENCIERAVILTTDDVIHSHHLPPSLQTAEGSGTTNRRSLTEEMETLEQELLIDALKTARGNMAKAARDLGISERVMGLRARKYALEPKRFKRKRD